MKNSPEKFCTFCGETLPLSQFKRRYKKSSTGEKKPKGWYSRCRPCLHKKEKEREKRKRGPSIAIRFAQRMEREEKEREKRAKRELIHLNNLERKNRKDCYYCLQRFERSEDFFLRLDNGKLSRACKDCEHLKGLGSKGKFRLLVSKIVNQKDFLQLRSLIEKGEKTGALKIIPTLHLSFIDFLKLLEIQNLLCAICDQPLLQPHVDHCHETNKIRGLLCSRCNLGLGLFRDKVENLNRAITYLTKETP